MEQEKTVRNVISFDSGVKSYDINGVENAVSFNPTDSAFVEHIFTVFDELDKAQQQKDAEISKTGDRRKVFELMREFDRDMRSAIDSVLGDGLCEKLFGSMNVYALAGGLPVWANLMLAVMDECDTAFAREQKLTNPRIKKYLDRFQKK